jgi:protein LSM12
VSRIQTFTVTSLASNVESGDSGFASAQPAIAKLGLDRLKKREEERVKKLKDDEQNRGKGVTKEAQAIFDSFKRMYVAPFPTHPCSSHDTNPPQQHAD